MALSKEDILERIYSALDPQDVIDRMGYTSEELCEILEREILDNLEKFYDIYEEDDEPDFE